jgi:hypothetical protein
MSNSKVKDLLKIVDQRRKIDMARETSAYNILAVIDEERNEAQAHSKIMYFLLEKVYNENGENDFLNLFLKEIKVPKKYTECLWKVYREYVFEEGRIYFVIETENFLIVIEMKIDAEDGYRQLERYDKFCKKKGKDYLIYYLTLNGSMPEKQSIGRMNSEKLCLISFEKHILNWLQACMYIVDNSSYSYSFVKQYDASVRHMLELEDEVMKVKDLIISTDMAKTALLIKNGFDEKMKELPEELLKNTTKILKRKSKLDIQLYDNFVDIYIDEIEYRKKTYYLVCELVIDYNLYACFGFCEYGERFLLRTEAEKLFPKFYKSCIKQIEELNLPQLHYNPRSVWFYIENTKGCKLNFKENSDSVLELIDEMDVQSKYIGENIFYNVLKPLSGYMKN